MAIIGPPDLPSVLKVKTDPLKKRILQHFGYPSVAIELTEDQLENIVRFVGNFVSTYFPKYERYAYFYTKPVQAKYDTPPDAWWIRSVEWIASPHTNGSNVQDLFGADMFLFCSSIDCKVYIDETESKLVPIDGLDEATVVTPYGPKHATFTKHVEEQPLVRVIHERGIYKCTSNTPIKTKVFDKEYAFSDWKTAEELTDKDVILTPEGKSKVLKIEDGGRGPTITVDVEEAHCCYITLEGEPILVH